MGTNSKKVLAGPEHYREAERLLGEVANLIEAAKEPMSSRSLAVRTSEIGIFLQGAQVHATLALAAATAYPENADRSEWVGVLS